MDDVLVENKALRAFDPEEVERAVEDVKRREAQERNRELKVRIIDAYTKDWRQMKKHRTAIWPYGAYIIVKIPLLTQSKHCPLHFPKRRPGPEGTAYRFRALLLEVRQ